MQAATTGRIFPDLVRRGVIVEAVAHQPCFNIYYLYSCIVLFWRVKQSQS